VQQSSSGGAAMLEGSGAINIAALRPVPASYGPWGVFAKTL
jgi:hypothetical protein